MFTKTCLMWLRFKRRNVPKFILAVLVFVILLNFYNNSTHDSGNKFNPSIKSGEINITLGPTINQQYSSVLSTRKPIKITNKMLNNQSNIEYKPRIFCILLTTKNNLNGKAFTVHETWAHKCDNHTFISIIDSSKSERIEIKYKNQFYVTQPANFKVDKYKLLTSKVYAAFQDVYDNHNQYDWYLKADDDTFIFMDNMRDFLKDKNKRLPVSYGHNFKAKMPGYHSGGAGYLLSHEAFRRMTQTLKKDKAFCSNVGIEDLDVRKCLDSLKVDLGDSTDHLERERFHPTNFQTHFLYTPRWLKWYSMYPPRKVSF